MDSGFTSSHHFYYFDQEGDKITFSNENDFLAVAKEDGTLRLFIELG